MNNQNNNFNMPLSEPCPRNPHIRFPKPKPSPGIWNKKFPWTNPNDYIKTNKNKNNPKLSSIFNQKYPWTNPNDYLKTNNN